MARQIQLRRGTTTQTNAFTGALAEVTVDTDKESGDYFLKLSGKEKSKSTFDFILVNKCEYSYGY